MSQSVFSGIKALNSTNVYEEMVSLSPSSVELKPLRLSNLTNFSFVSVRLQWN